MSHDTPLIATIVVGLVLAFGGGLLANKLRLPPLVGYLLAGVVVGPFTPGFIADPALAGQLAEIGVILLMFGVGLQFSMGDLVAVRRIAVPGALVQIALATVIGAGSALAWGWSLGAGLVLGLSLSVASTVVLLRALDLRNALDSENGRIAVGWLIVEDLTMVLALVLLPALAGPLGAEPREAATPILGSDVAVAVALTSAKIGAFIALVLFVGKRLVPWLLEQVARTGSRELFTLSVLAVALGIAYGSAALFGVSFALGAFFAGVVLSESDFSHQAAADSLPLKDAFAVLFFVSIGMLFDPSILVREPLAVGAVLLIIILGKSLAAFAIVLAFGYPVNTALTISASLAQIGEFSFILAGLGIALGLLPPEGRDLILAGALLSIALNPLVFAAVDPIVDWLRAHPWLMRHLERTGGRLSVLKAVDISADALRDHVVIIGYGRVGGTIGEALKAQRLPFVVVEQNRRRIEDLRAHGVSALYGDATAAGVLESAHVDRARLMVLATPGGFQAQRIIELARAINPRIDTVVRTHSESEIAQLERQGVGLAVMAEREIALRMLEYALQSLGFSEEKARFAAEGVRKTGEGGAFERRSEAAPPYGAPELRSHTEL